MKESKQARKKEQLYIHLVKAICIKEVLKDYFHIFMKKGRAICDISDKEKPIS